jgi:hypothetical protein
MTSLIYARPTSRVAAVVAAGAMLMLPMVALAGSTKTKTITPKTTGSPYTSKPKVAIRPSFISFTVSKQGKRYRVAHFAIQCTVSARNLGAYVLENGPTISSSGRFSYTGKVGVYENDAPTPVGSAKLKLTGHFTSSTKATGTAIIRSAKPTLKDCPGKSFTASYTA